jgi:hypothetical protein
VAFSVNVKLVEKIAKSHDGNVMVVKVISQRRTPGMAFMKDRISCPNKLSKELPCGRSLGAVIVPVVIVMTLGSFELAEFIWLYNLPKLEETGSTEDVSIDKDVRADIKLLKRPAQASALQSSIGNLILVNER